MQPHYNITNEWALNGVTMPTRCHKLPAICVKPRQPFWSQTLPHCRPELLLVTAGIESPGKFCVVGTDVPEEDSKGIDVYGVVV